VKIPKGLRWFVNSVSLIETKIERILQALDAVKEGIMIPLVRRFCPDWLSPNHVTGSRGIVGLGVIAWLIATGGTSYQNNNWFAVLVIFLCATDFLDGLIARAKNQKSRFGSFFDKVVDKLLILPLGTVEFWPLDQPLVILSIGGTVVVLITATYKYLQGKSEVPENIFGRVGMILYSLGIIIAIWPDYQPFAWKLAWLGCGFGFCSIILNFGRHFGLSGYIHE